MDLKIIQIGNSEGMILPKEYLRKLGFKRGSKLSAELTPDRKNLIIGKPGKKASSITPEFVKILEGVNKRYGQALAKLARL